VRIIASARVSERRERSKALLPTRAHEAADVWLDDTIDRLIADTASERVSGGLADPR
jgi:hypothetical protein